MAGTSSANDANLFMQSVHSNMYTLDYQPWVANEAPISCVYLSDMSDYGGTQEGFTYRTLEDPGMKLMPYDARFSIGPRTGCEFSTAFSNGTCWSPVACAMPSRGPLLEAEPPQLWSQRPKWHRTKGSHSFQDTNKSTCQTHSVGTDAILGGLRDMEEEFPKLLLAAGGLLSPCDSISVTSGVSGDRKAASCICKQFDPYNAN